MDNYYSLKEIKENQKSKDSIWFETDFDYKRLIEIVITQIYAHIDIKNDLNYDFENINDYYLIDIIRNTLLGSCFVVLHKPTGYEISVPFDEVINIEVFWDK